MTVCIRKEKQLNLVGEVEAKDNSITKNSCSSEICWSLYSLFCGIKHMPPLQSLKGDWTKQYKNTLQGHSYVSKAVEQMS